MEGWFWRLTDARTGRSVIVLCGVNRDRLGGRWAIAGLASHPGGFSRDALLPDAYAAGDRYALTARGRDGAHVRADPGRLEIRLGPDAWLRVALDAPHGWPRRRPYGGLGIGHALPGLGQYWHPHALGGRATGEAVLGGEHVVLRDANVYAEKNWSTAGFPERWWWGQAGAFGGADACVAFAGGRVHVGPVGLDATAVVVRVEDRVLRFGNPVLTPVTADVSDEAWRLRGTGPRYSVEIEGEGAPGDAHVLPVPLPAERRTVPGSLQHLGGRMHVTVRRHGRRCFAGESLLAGLEHGGCEGAEAELRRRATAAAPAPLAA